MKENLNIPPSLYEIKNELPFTTPADYFKSFPERLNQRIQNEQRITIERAPHFRWKSYAAAAIILIAAIIAGNAIYNKSSLTHNQGLHAEISDLVEIELYSINEQTILEVMGDESFDLSAGSNEDETIDFLLNEGLNESDILNSL